MNKVLYLVLPLVLILGLCGMHYSNAATYYFEPYPFKKSNAIMTISVDKSTYQQGDTINVLGQVNNYNQGSLVHLIVLDSGKNPVATFNTVVNRAGLFSSPFVIPTTFPNGKYSINAWHEGDSPTDQVSLGINIFNGTNLGYVYIPLGASTQENKLNFDPPTINITKGAKIIWINNDYTLHTVISGKLYPNGTLIPNGFITSGYIHKDETFTASPGPGKYIYYCQLHPWLSGTIFVKAPVAPTKTVKPTTNATKPVSPIVKPTNTTKTVKPTNATKPVSPTVKPSPFPISDSTLQSIWKDHAYLQRLFPEVAQGKLDNLKKWATTKGWNSDKLLSKLIPPGKIPSYLNSVLKTIWKDRKDLQNTYPEVAKGKLDNLKKWAVSSGWKEYDRLSVLTPAK